MRFNFEKFTDPDSSYDAKISIRRTGQFGFSAGAVNKFHLAQYPFAILYYDAGQRAIGIQLQKEKSEGALELNSSPSNFHIRAKNFCDRFEIDYRTSRRFSLCRDEESRFLFFELCDGEETEENGSENESG